MDYTDLLNRLNDATDDELAEAREAIIVRLGELRADVEARTVNDEQLAEIEQLGDAFRQIRETLTGRETAANERAERAAEVLGEVEPADEAPDEDTPDEGGDGGESPDGEAEVEVEAPAEEGERVPVSAAARPPLGAVAARTRTRPRPTVPPIAIRAAADISGFAAGQNLNRDELVQAFGNRLQAIRGKGGQGERVYVASLASDATDPRRLRRDDPAGNSRRIDAQDPRRGALTAAGGLCAPFTPDYSIGVLGSSARPVRDSLAGYQAERGGISFRRNLDIAAATADASSVWTNAMDELVGDPVDAPDPKPFATVDCPAMVEAEVEAEVFQVEFSNVTARFDPESTAANVELLTAAHARWQENRLLVKLATGSTTVTSAQALGATRDLLALLNKVIAYYRSAHRLDQRVQLNLILPQWVIDLIAVDLVRAMHTSNMDYFAVAESKIVSWLTARGVNPTFHLDGNTADVTGPPAIAAQQYAGPLSAGAVPGFPGQVEMILYVAGEWIYMDGGSLDLGLVRDSTLIGNNRYRMFSEEWNQPVFRGTESLHVIASVEPNGASVGTVAPALTD